MLLFILSLNLTVSSLLFASGSISGKLTLQSRTNNSCLITFKLTIPGQSTPLNTYQITTAPDGSYTLNDIPIGIYNLSAKASNSLSRNNVLIEVFELQNTPSIDFYLLGGDADNDNYINYKDRNILKKAYGSINGSLNWDSRADFNNDNMIDYKDLNLLKKNYGLLGTEPLIKITSPSDNSFTNISSITVSGTANDNTCQVSVNSIPALISGNNFTASDIPLIQGPNRISAVVVNLIGNKNACLINVTYDTDPPSINIYTPDNNSTTRSSIVYGRVSDDTASVTVNGTPATVSFPQSFSGNPDTAYFIARPTLTEGPNAITVQATDKAGNISQKQITITYNTQTPKLTIASPIDNSIQNISPINVGGTNTTDLKYILISSLPAHIDGTNFTAEGITLNPDYTLITAEGYDQNDNLFEDSVFVTSPQLADYQFTDISGNAYEYDDTRPSAGSTQTLKVTLEKNGRLAAGEEIKFGVITPLPDGERAGVRGQVTPQSVFTDSNGEAQTTLTTDTNSSVTNKVDCLLTNNPLVNTTFVVYTKPGLPSTLIKITDDSITPVPGATVDLIVKITDANNNPIPDETINFQMAQGNGTLSSPTAVTTNYGEARVALTTTPNANESAQIVASSTSNPSLTVIFNITTSQPVSLTFDEVMAKVNENGNKVQDYSADVVKLSDESGAAPEERYKLWKKGSKSKIQLTYPEQRSYIMERTQNSINLDGKPFLTTAGSGQGTGATVSKTVESASGDIYVLQVSIKTPKSQELTRTYVDYSKGVITRVSSEVSNEFTRSSFEKEYSHILVSGIWLPEKITTKTTNFVDNTVHIKTETFSNITVNSGIPDSFFQ